jgi:hypothetical protein
MFVVNWFIQIPFFKFIIEFKVINYTKLCNYGKTDNGYALNHKGNLYNVFYNFILPYSNRYWSKIDIIK